MRLRRKQIRGGNQEVMLHGMPKDSLARISEFHSDPPCPPFSKRVEHGVLAILVTIGVPRPYKF